jgi:hypothetical protein
MQLLEFRSKQIIHKAHAKASPEFITFHKFYITESDTELLLQTEFEFIKVLQSSSAVENKRQSSDDTRHHDEART